MKPRRTSSGRWRVDVKYQGKRATVTGDTAAEARQRGAEKLIELGGTPEDRVTVGELLETHMAAAESEMARQSWDNYRRCVDRLPAEFTERSARSVNPIVIDALYRQLERAGVSAHQITKTHTVLGVAWQRGIRYGWVERNPVRDVRAPKVRTPEVSPPDPAEIAKVLEHADPAFRLFLRVAASLGARRGELVALQWHDVDLDTGQVIIRRSHSYAPKVGVTENDTKTSRKGHRVITLGGRTLTELRSHRAAQVARALERGLPAPTYIFSRDAGQTAWFVDSPTNMMRDARERAGLTQVQLKNVRHYVATQMLANGESVAQVAGRLGHSTPATTMRVYAHWIPANDQRAADMLDDLLDGTGS